MKCLIYFGMSSRKEGTSAQLSGRGELHGGARVTTLVTLRKCTLGNKREIKTLKFVSASTKAFKGGLAWIKPSKKDMAVTFSYSSCFDPDSLLLAYYWLGLSWIDFISANKSFSSPKTSSRKPYTNSKQQERQNTVLKPL